MNAAIYDDSALRALGVSELSAYLRTTGWNVARPLGDRATLWHKRTENDDEFEVFVPQRRSFDDYALRIKQALTVLAAVEMRSELVIYRDIILTQTDTVRLQFRSSLFEDGSVPLAQAVKMVEQAREMMLAAACAAVQPRAYYHKRKPTQAMEYLEKVRLGQTEQGSFVLALQTTVPPRLRLPEAQEESLFPETAPPPEEPFERRVTMTLAQSVLEAAKAALSANITGDLSPFQQAVSIGVNANLCDAIADMGLETPTQEFSVDFHWSPSRALIMPMPGRVDFTPDLFQTLREAARLFRENAPLEDFELEGFVVGLKRDEGEMEGQITVSGIVDNSPRRIQVILGDADYQLALEAHGQEQAIRCTGELVKEGRSYVLHNPRSFAILA